MADQILVMPKFGLTMTEGMVSEWLVAPGQAFAAGQPLVAIETELARVKGRPIPINIDGIVAALVLDFGLPEGCAAAFVMIPRSFSTLAHHLEEKSQGTRWRHVPQEDVTYTGAIPGSP